MTQKPLWDSLDHRARSAIIALTVLATAFAGAMNMGAMAEEQVLQGGVTKIWSIDEARSEALREAEHWMDVTMFPEKDPNRGENKKALKDGRFNYKGRRLTRFENGSYGVEFRDFSQAFYYRKNGKLSAVDFFVGTGYPYKTYKYSYPFGRLVRVSITVAPSETFTFTPRGQLTNHWKGDYCYKEDGSPCGTRKAWGN